MNISKVELILQRNVEKDDSINTERSHTMSLTATEDGFEMMLFDKSYQVKDKATFRTWYCHLTQIECINNIIINVFDTDGFQVYVSVKDLLDMTKLRKIAENNDTITNEDEDTWDYDTRMVFHWYYVNSILPFLTEIENTVSILKKTKEIVGLECPVLSEALTVDNARKFTKCNHWICSKALDGILKTQTTAEIKCPMCREEHYRSNIESI
jgi:hypothetical protein